MALSMNASESFSIALPGCIIARESSTRGRIGAGNASSSDSRTTIGPVNAVESSVDELVHYSSRTVEHSKIPIGVARPIAR